MSLWQRFPVFRSFLALAAGILWANFLSSSFYFFLIFFGLSVLAALVCGLSKKLFFKFNRRWFFGLSITCCFFALGVLSSHLYSEKIFPQHLVNAGSIQKFYQLQLLDDPLEKENSFGVQARVLRSSEDSLSAKIMLYLAKSGGASKLRYGDRIAAQAFLNPLTPPRNPNEFDYRNYLQLKAIYYQTYVDSSQWRFISAGHGFELIAASKRIRRKLMVVIDNWELGENREAITKALLLGYRHEIEDDQLKAYASAGAMHVLAVSGLHVGIVYLMAFYALYFMERIPQGKLLRMALLILLLWFYACLTGFSASVVRAATMFTFVAIGSSLNRTTSVYNTILGSAMLLLLLKPTYLFEVGFQLSYAAVLGIVWLQPRLEKLWHPSNWPARQLWAITTVSLAAQIATFPLGLYYFHQFPSLFLLSNLMVIPIVTALMYIGLSCLMLSLTGWIPEFLVSSYEFLLGLMNAGVSWVEKQSFMLLDQIHITRLELVLLYVIIIAGCTWLMAGGYRRLVIVMLSLVIFSGSQVWEQYQLNHQQQTVAYAVRQKAAIGLYSPEENIFISDPDLRQNDDALTFHVKHHWWALDARKVQFLDISENFRSKNFRKEKNLLFANATSIWLYDKAIENLPATDQWWIISDVPPPPDSPPAIPDQVVLTGAVGYYHQKEWAQWSKEQAVPVWNTSEKGAYLYR